MRALDVIIAIILTLFTIFLAYFLAKNIESIEKSKNFTENVSNKLSKENKENLGIEEIKKEASQSEKTENSNNTTLNFSSILPSESLQQKTSEQKTYQPKIINYTKFEEAYVYDACYSENLISVEGKNLICTNEIPRKIEIKKLGNEIEIVYNDILKRKENYSDEILLMYAYAKDFYGVEGEVKNIFTNSTFARIGEYIFGEIKFNNQTIVYLSFPVFAKIDEIKNETLEIFVETSIKNYLISSIEISTE